MRIVYLGTPAYATIPLEALAQAGGDQHEIVGVITQPDRPAGRGTAPQPPPVKLAAQRLGLPVIQPETLRDEQAIAQLRAWQPDLGVVAAYGEILRRAVLAIPPLGYLNIHPSLLPRHRGPTPVAGAILAGDSETGVSVIKLDAKMDAGPILAQARAPLAPDARTDPLTTELFGRGAALLLEALASYAAGQRIPTPQDEALATYTRLLARADGQIDWQHSAVQIARMTRAYDLWPGAYTTWRGQPLKIIAARPISWDGTATPGTLLDRAEGVAAATGAGALLLETVQPAGKRPMDALAWRRGQRDRSDARLGADSSPVHPK